MSTENLYDVIVVGGGAIGLATAYEVAKSGKSVLVLERSNFFNQSGSSGDIVRMYRTMYTEFFMAKLAKQSLDIWKELEQDAADNDLRMMSGLLNFGDPEYGGNTPEGIQMLRQLTRRIDNFADQIRGTLLGPIENLKKLGMSFEKLTAAEIQSRYPFKGLDESWMGLFAPDNGCINVPRLLRTLYRLSSGYGAKLIQQMKVTKVEPSGSSKDHWQVHVQDTYGNSMSHFAKKIVITCGAYTNHVVTPSFGFHLNLNIWEMVATYFNISSEPNQINFPSMWFQFAEDKNGRSQLFYGFPEVPWGQSNLARISVDAATRQISDPEERQPSHISPEDIEDTREWVKNHIVGADATVAASALTCLQTNVYDNMFVLDYIPDQYLCGGKSKSIAVFTAGWAMKFTPLLGRALKELVLDGGSDYALPEFSILRKSDDGTETIISPGPVSTSQGEVRVQQKQMGGSSRRR